MKYYRYEIILKEPIYPRHLADRMSYLRDVRLVDIKDQQNNSHIYGDTYYVDRPNTFRKPK